ncbi:hypothetical protein AKO1_011539 [Acrasis kona]|uniref:Uncharacterized protein n=1 Tax=Acrasis kona TaxID=1008807 RepID=A0AAW2Z0F4_9EUKA
MMRTLGNSTTDNSDDLLTTSTTTAAVDATSPLQHQMDENSPTNTTAAHYMNENRHSFINMLRHKRKDSLPVDTTCLDALSNIDVKLMSRLVYILQMDDVMIYYTPKPGRKEFHRFGGRSQIFYKPGRNNDHSLSTSPVSPTTDKSFSEPNLHSMTSNSTNHSSIGNLINLRISNNNQMLQANRNVDWLMNDFENFIHAMMMQGKREKRSSGGLEQTLEMITLLRDSMFKGPWTHQPVISKNHQQQTQQQQSPPPIDYRSIYGNALGEIPSTSANNSMIALKKKKSSLVGRSPFRSQTLQPNSTATTTMLRNTSTDLINIIPSLNDLNMPQKPLVCICSRHLQVIPWELMFDAFATRSFTLKDMLQRRTTIRAAQKERYMPTYFCFYSEDEQKFIAPVERQRKDWLFQEFRRHAHLSAQDSAIFHDMLPNLPLHTPLVTYGKKTKSYKNRYKHVNFIKLSQIADKPTQIITHIESFLTSPQYPVFLFTLADLMDLSEAILCVLSYRPDCTLLFIAEGAMVTAVEMLMDMQNMYERNKQLSGNCTSRQGYQFLAHCIHVMRKQLGIPIVVINPPSC